MENIEIPTGLKIKYLGRRKQELKNINTYLKMNNYQEIFLIFHQIKGNAVMVGLPQLQQIAIEILSSLEDSHSTLKNDIKRYENCLTELIQKLS